MSFFRTIGCLITLFFVLSCEPEEEVEDPCQAGDASLLSISNLLGTVYQDQQGQLFLEALMPEYFEERVRIYSCNGINDLQEGASVFFSVSDLNFSGRIGEYSIAYAGEINYQKIALQPPVSNDCQPMSEEIFSGESQEFRILDLRAFKNTLNEQYCLEVSLRYEGCPDARITLYENEGYLGFNPRMALSLEYQASCDEVQYQQYLINITDYVNRHVNFDQPNPQLKMIFDQWGRENVRTVRVI